jgi:hypothetical protein
LRRKARCHDTATRPTLVAVETEDAQVRGVVASAVLTLDDVVNAEWIVLASSMTAVRAEGMSGDHLVTKPAPLTAVSTCRCATTTLVLRTLGMAPALVTLTFPRIRRDVLHAPRAATQAGHFFFCPGNFCGALVTALGHSLKVMGPCCPASTPALFLEPGSFGIHFTPSRIVDDVSSSYVENRQHLVTKRWALRFALVAVAAEVIFVASALIAA